MDNVLKGDSGERELSAEERHQRARHDLEYGEVRERSRLRMARWDWERFDQIQNTGEPYIASIQRLGPVRGKTILDAGCGDGWLSVILSKRGAHVLACDISFEAVKTANERFRANHVEDACEAVVASLYSLPYAGNSVDLVCGQAILHHVSQKDRVAEELHRVMRPGARAIFLEPFCNSSFLFRLRRLVPVESQSRDSNERQLEYADLEPFRRYFGVAVQEWQLLSRVDRLIKSMRVVHAIQQLDLRLLSHFSWLRPYARAIVIELRHCI